MRRSVWFNAAYFFDLAAPRLAAWPASLRRSPGGRPSRPGGRLRAGGPPHRKLSGIGVWFPLVAAFAAAVNAPSAPISTCSDCHPAQARAHASTSMARALERAEESGILRSNPKLAFRNGPYAYTIERQGERSIYTLTDGTQTLSVPISWAFGLGAAGQTYLFQRNGNWYESRVSFYKEVHGLDLTLGAPNAVPKDIIEAAGRQMTVKDGIECFGCHSYGGVVDSKLQLENVTPGVQCGSCHAGGDRHAAAIKAGNPKEAAMRKPDKLTAEDVSELCGRCHRTWADIAANGPQGVANVRFQPYRLTNSKCYDAVDRRISCVACHDPHQEIDHSSSAYDAKCLACHSPRSSARICHTGKSDCAGCHMPKYEIPGSHHLFSDHQIRIVRPHEPYPN